MGWIGLYDSRPFQGLVDSLTFNSGLFRPERFEAGTLYRSTTDPAGDIGLAISDHAAWVALEGDQLSEVLGSSSEQAGVRQAPDQDAADGVFFFDFARLAEYFAIGEVYENQNGAFHAFQWMGRLIGEYMVRPRGLDVRVSLQTNGEMGVEAAHYIFGGIEDDPYSASLDGVLPSRWLP